MRRQRIGLLLGPALFAASLGIPASAELSPAAIAVFAVAVWMATWWTTEAVPMAATALLPIALFPLLGVMPTAEVTLAYANHLIYLFLGGFLIAMAIQKWDLHRRIALHTIRWVGITPARIVLGFMLATAFLSAWISNTATVMMMVTIGIAVLGQFDAGGPQGQAVSGKASGFGTLLMLSIAYSASIGGVATLIGTPPNAILVAILEQRLDIHIGFAEWMLFGLPVSLCMLALSWFYLTRIAFRAAAMPSAIDRASLDRQIHELGRMSPQEVRVLAIFGLVVSGWLLRGFVDLPWLSGVSDASIAMIGAVLLFAIPADWRKREFLLDWDSAVQLPWDVIVLFGGGFALASGFADSGLTTWIGGRLALLGGAGMALTVVVVVVLVIFLTEVTSNTATASLLIPVIIGFALAVDLPPLPMAVAVATAASYAFMLPVATPPNAIIFSSRQVSIPQMVRVGIWLNLLGMLVISVFVLLLLPLIWGA